MNSTDSVEKLNGVGPSNAKKLAKLGIFVVEDLLRHFPFRYDDLSKITPLAQVSAGGTFAIRAEIVKKKLRPSFGRRVKILEALLQDDTATIMAAWFNQPYLNEALKEGQTYLFAGPAVFYKSLQMQNPAWELDKPRTLHIGRIVPVYPLTGGIYPKWLRSLIKQALEKTGSLPEFLPNEITKAQKLLPYAQAIRFIHFPENPRQLEEARRRLSFDELFLHELKIIQHKKSLQKSRATPLPFQAELAKAFVSGLPFELTRSQKIAAWQIMQDLEKPHPANRILAGDVGSGKTVVAAMTA
ncbi:MAG: DNA helicase RecG, partial [bacterium]|nr:DNA helicase RecG [bacterium]